MKIKLSTATPCKRRSTPQQVQSHHQATTTGAKGSKRLRSTSSPLNQLTSRDAVLSNDTLFHIFSFFFSSPRCEKAEIDEEAIRAIQLTCKKWYHIVVSTSMWSLLDSRNNILTRQHHISSAQMKTRRGSKTMDSLLGFKRLATIASDVECTAFEAQDRATNDTCHLLVSKTSCLPRRFMRLLFCDHREFGASLWSPVSERRHIAQPASVAPRTHHISSIQPHNGGHLIRRDILSPSMNEALLSNGTSSGESLPDSNSFRHFLALEKEEEAAFSDAMVTQPVRHRCEMVDYLLEVVSVFEMEAKHAFRAMYFVDQYWRNSRRHAFAALRGQQPAKPQLIILACVFLVSKCHEGDVRELQLGDLVFSADNKFTVKEIDDMVVAVFSSLQGRIAQPTIWDFLSSFDKLLTAEDESMRNWALWSYVAELAIQTRASHMYSPSIVAAACVILAAQIQGVGHIVEWWRIHFAEYTGYNLNEMPQFRQCLVDLSRQLFDIDRLPKKWKSIQRRYDHMMELPLLHRDGSPLFESSAAILTM